MELQQIAILVKVKVKKRSVLYNLKCLFASQFVAEKACAGIFCSSCVGSEKHLTLIFLVFKQSSKKLRLINMMKITFFFFFQIFKCPVSVNPISEWVFPFN